MKYITKTIFVEAMKCASKASHLANKTPRHIPSSLQYLFDTGNYVNDVNRNLIPEGTLIEGTNKEAAQKTKEALDSGAKTIYEATFIVEDLLCRVDQLNLLENGSEIIEVKSSTGVEPEYLWDVAFQWYVASKSNMNPQRAILRHCDSVSGFKDNDITDIVKEHLKTIEEEIKNARFYIYNERKPEASEHCLECPFREQCFPKSFTLDEKGYSKGQIIKLMISGEDSIAPENLLPRQQGLILKTKDHEEFIGEGLKELLKYQNYQVLDFEAFHDPMRGYQPFPFLAGTARVSGTEIIPASFFHEEMDDLRPLAYHLRKTIDLNTPLLAFNKVYEVRVLKIIQALSGVDMTSIMNILEDPLPLLREHYYHRDLKFSFSLKALTKVLLLAGESYDGLEVKNGLEAQEMFLKRVRGLKSPEQIHHLSTYCEKDVVNTASVVIALQEKIRAKAS